MNRLRAGVPSRPNPARGSTMPESPAQDLLTLPKSAAARTERMATPEELYALKRIAEVERAIAELARKEQPADSSRELLSAEKRKATEASAKLAEGPATAAAVSTAVAELPSDGEQEPQAVALVQR